MLDMHRRLALVGSILLVAVGSVWAAEDADLPLDAPNDAIMASPAEVLAMHNWVGAAFLGGPPNAAEKSFLEVALPCSFRYDGADSRELLKTWKRSVESTDAADRVQHQVTWTDPKTGLRVIAVVGVFKRYPAVDWVLHFENQGQQDTPILEDIQALDTIARTSVPSQAAVLHRIIGDVQGERSYLPTETALDAGTAFSMAAVGGRSSSGAFPFFNCQYGDEGVITAIGWSGQWVASADRAGAGPTRLRAGIEKTHLVLHPGERIRSPRILIMPWKGDRLTAHQRFRRLVMFQYEPKQNGRPLQLLFSNVSFMFYYASAAGGNENAPSQHWITEAGQIEAAKFNRDLGCNAHWVDACWYDVGFWNGNGNWYPHKGFPNGLKPVSDASHDMGLKFILWFEPERVCEGSQIAREHPEFVFPGPNAVNNLFKLNDPIARRWLTDFLSKRITEYGVDVYRHDFNIEPLDFWRKNDAPDRQGMTEIRYVEGLYAMWDELLARHPGLWIDNCSAGARRTDLETTTRSIVLWRCDTDLSGEMIDLNQMQTQGLSMYLPLISGGCASKPEAYDIRSASAAGGVYNLDYINKPMDQAKPLVAEARENQKYWYGDFYPLTPASLKADQWAAYQAHRPDIQAGIVLAFRRGACQQPTLVVKLGAIDPTANYLIEFIDDALQKVLKTIPGRELAESLELQLPTPRSSLLIRYRKESK